MTLSDLIKSQRVDAALASVEALKSMTADQLARHFGKDEAVRLLSNGNTNGAVFDLSVKVIRELSGSNETREVVTSALMSLKSKASREGGVLELPFVRRMFEKEGETVHVDYVMSLLHRYPGTKSSYFFSSPSKTLQDLPIKLLGQNHLLLQDRKELAAWVFLAAIDSAGKVDLKLLHSVLSKVMSSASAHQREAIRVSFCLALYAISNWRVELTTLPGGREASQAAASIKRRNCAARFIADALDIRGWAMQYMKEEPRVLAGLVWAGVFRPEDRGWLEHQAANVNAGENDFRSIFAPPYIHRFKTFLRSELPVYDTVEIGNLRGLVKMWSSVGAMAKAKLSTLHWNDRAADLYANVQAFELACANGMECAASLVTTSKQFNTFVDSFPRLTKEDAMAIIPAASRRSIVREMAGEMKF